MEHATVSTEIVINDMSCPLTVEWNTVPPTHTGHINLKLMGIHLILNGAARMGSATVMCDYHRFPPEWMGIIARGVGTIGIRTS